MKRNILIALLAAIAMMGQAQEKTIVWEQPCTEINTLIDDSNRVLLEITRVEFADDETRLMMHISCFPEVGVRIDPGTHLVADGKPYALKSLDGMEIGSENYPVKYGFMNVVFHFEPLPKDTKRFDFTEGDIKGAFKLLGVEDVKSRAEKLFPSNWRDAQTGDWDISFYDEGVIYDCQFWNYKQKQQNGDGYTIILENGGKEVNVSVDKNKDGKRNITIDGKTGEYNFISSVAMPDYPQKDTRNSFMDTHYQTDTITLIGWLRNMPEAMKKNSEFEVTVYDDILFSGIHNGNTYYGKTDSLGHFVLKVPILNSAEAFLYLKYASIFTLFEPGETYFLLYDFKGGHKLFMGKDCRLQNEILAHPKGRATEGVYVKMDGEAAAMEFLEKTRKAKAKDMALLKRVVKDHPNISERYIRFMTDNYNAIEGNNLIRVRAFIKDENVIAETHNLADRYWQESNRPYTLCREFRPFMRNYTKNLIIDHYFVRYGNTYSITNESLYPLILRKYRDAGKVRITDDELAIAEQYGEGRRKYSAWAADDLKTERASKKFGQSDCVKQFGEIFKREDIKNAITAELPLYDVYRAIGAMDSICCDEDMRDIIIINKLHEYLNQNREALPDLAMQFMEENVKMPAAKDFLKAQNEKYLAIQHKDISKSSSLKSSEDVANMSDGEQMLRKLTEPYRGKIILMDIWGTWCGPCKAALKNSQEEYKRLKDYDIVYLYLANRSPEETWKSIIKEYEVLGDNVVHYNLPEDQQQAIEHFVKISGYPTYKLIDKEGNLLDVNADPRDMEALARLLDKLR